MMIINRVFATTVFFVLLGFMTTQSLAQNADSARAVDVSLCELIKNPQKYDRKIVRVRGIYRSSFELSELFCPECYQKDRRIWIASRALSEKCLKSKERRRLDKARTLVVVFVGEFQSSERTYGHSNGYRFQIDLMCVEESRVLSKDKPLLPNELKEFGISENCQCR